MPNGSVGIQLYAHTPPHSLLSGTVGTLYTGIGFPSERIGTYCRIRAQELCVLIRLRTWSPFDGPRMESTCTKPERADRVFTVKHRAPWHLELRSPDDSRASPSVLHCPAKSPVLVGVDEWMQQSGHPSPKWHRATVWARTHNFLYAWPLASGPRALKRRAESTGAGTAQLWAPQGVEPAQRPKACSPLG